MARFSSKRDPWAVVLLPATAIGASGAAVALLVSDAVPVTKLLIATVCFAAALFIMSLLLRTYYELTDGRLEVRHGPFRWSISIFYNRVRDVGPQLRFFGAALSVERFMVRYRPGYSRWKYLRLTGLDS